KVLPLSDFGRSWIHPEIPCAHPLTDGSAYACYKSVDETASQLGNDRQKYVDIFSKLTNDWPYISENILSPLPLSYHPIRLARFGLKALLPATLFARTFFSGKGAQLLFCGAAAHSTLPLSYIATTSFGLVLNILAHKVGWPFPKGGAGEIIKALIAYYKYYGGELYLNRKITDLQELPDASAYIFDLTPRQLLEINGTRFSTSYRRRLSNYKYGAGVFKIDWALSQPIPFLNEKCRRAGTVHLGYSLEEIEDSEAMIHKGETSDTPYVLLTQQSVFDDSR